MNQGSDYVIVGKKGDAFIEVNCFRITEGTIIGVGDIYGATHRTGGVCVISNIIPAATAEELILIFDPCSAVKTNPRKNKIKYWFEKNSPEKRII
jgi:hypothetical protein